MKTYVIATTLLLCVASLAQAQDLPTTASRNDAEAQQRAGQAATNNAATLTYRGKTGRAAERAYKSDKVARERHKEDNVIHGTNLPGGYTITPDGTWLNPDGSVAVASDETPKEKAKRLKETESLRKKHAKEDRRAGRRPN